MEEVMKKLECALIIPEDKPVKTEFECFYKNWGRLGNQEERRKELLENQKNKRNNKLDKFRGILDLVNAVEENDIFKQDHKSYYRPSIYVAGFNKTSLSYNNVLMLSEWMVERPEDFHENWYVSPCPKGGRVLVIANRGKTKCFSKFGHFKFQTHTLIPGGSPHAQNSQRGNCCCILDCFYQEKEKTLYVIDFLAWNNQPMTDCETEFRNFWLQSQFAERPELGVISKRNKVKFILLPKVQCTLEQFNEFMMTWPPFENLSTSVDGLLFYHKKAHYISGETPLVGWLFPYMVHEILGADITVNPAYLLDKPEDYVDQATFIKKFDEKIAEKEAKRSATRGNMMDTTDAVHSETKSDEMDADETSEKTGNDPEKVEMDNSNNNNEDSAFHSEPFEE